MDKGKKIIVLYQVNRPWTKVKNHCFVSSHQTVDKGKNHCFVSSQQTMDKGKKSIVLYQVTRPWTKVKNHCFVSSHQTMDKGNKSLFCISLLFSPLSPALVLVDDRPFVATTPHFCIHPIIHWLLQCHVRWPSSLHAPTSSVCTEHCGTVHHWSTSTGSHYWHHAVTTLAADCLPDSLQALPCDVCCYNRTTTFYIVDTTTRISMLPGHCWLQSAMTSEFDIPCIRTKFRDREISLG